MSSVNDIKKDSVIRFKGDAWMVTDFQHVNPGKGSAFVRTKLKNMKTGKVQDNTFKAAENVEFLELDRKSLQYTYNDGQNWYFMDASTFEEIFIPKERIEDKAGYLKEGMELDGWFLEGECLSVNLPRKITYKVVEATPAVKGDTSSGNVTKEVTLETGMKINVPIFIKQGDEIVVNTDEGTYVERA
jgi:elongation factor P